MKPRFSNNYGPFFNLLGENNSRVNHTTERLQIDPVLDSEMSKTMK